MSSDFPYLLCLVYTIIDSSNSQYMFGKKVNKSACDDSNKTSYVEHFFNVIFNEFHTSPPVCVCVQMCDDQPTYCYPNGCLKRIDNKKKINDDIRPPVTYLKNDDSTKTMFLVDERNDFTHALNNADENKNAQKQTAVTRDFFSDPLKAIYKTLFKYKKMPRVELRYNLREQIKNMKSDVLKLETDDISKTRWPKTHHKIFHEQKVHTNEKYNERKSPDAGGNAKKFFSHPNGQESYTSKYFKRDLRRSQSSDPVDRLMGDEQSDVSNKGFSIETLIDNLIGNSFNGANDAKNDLTNATNTNNTINETNNHKEMMCVYSLNLTNENRDENKYVDDIILAEVVNKWSNFTFNDMIAALSKQIDAQNNTSMEMIKRSKGFTVKKGNLVENSTNTNITESRDNKTLIPVIKQANFTILNNNTNNTVVLDSKNATAVNVD